LLVQPPMATLVRRVAEDSTIHWQAGNGIMETQTPGRLNKSRTTLKLERNDAELGTGCTVLRLSLCQSKSHMPSKGGACQKPHAASQCAVVVGDTRQVSQHATRAIKRIIGMRCTHSEAKPFAPIMPCSREPATLWHLS
jgi:hypothetical protein